MSNMNMTRQHKTVGQSYIYTQDNSAMKLQSKQALKSQHYCVKVVLIGDLNVGKTSLILALVGAENVTVVKGQITGKVKTEFRRSDCNVKMDIWDTAVLGDYGVGKSKLLSSFCYGDNGNAETNFSTRYRKDIIFQDQRLQINISDTAGQERYRSLTASYYRGAHGCLILFDVTKHHTFESVSSWYADLKQYSINPENISTILVGTRCHAKKREVSKEKAESFADHIGIPYMEVSAEEGINVKEVFDLLADNILEVYQRHPSMCVEPSLSTNLSDQDSKKKVFWCSC